MVSCHSKKERQKLASIFTEAMFYELTACTTIWAIMSFKTEIPINYYGVIYDSDGRFDSASLIPIFHCDHPRILLRDYGYM
jgi:hypothetical protein